MPKDVVHRESKTISNVNSKGAIKEQVIAFLKVGKTYRIKSLHCLKEGGRVARCKLLGMYKNMVTFEHTDKTRESFTYAEIWIQMSSGDMMEL